MKKIVLSLAIITVVSAVSIGGTMAYFTATTTVDDNVLATGSVALGDYYGLPFEINNLAPGDRFEHDMRIEYDGSLPADLYLGVQEQDEEMDLGPVLQYKIERMDSDWDHTGWIAGGWGSDGWEDFQSTPHLLSEYVLTHSGLEQGDNARARLHIRMMDDSDDVDFEDIDAEDWNDYQGVEEKVRLILHTVQAGAEAPTEPPRKYEE